MALFGLIGLLVLIINATNLVSILTPNFNVAKGDPMKTHLFSFLLVFSFYYVLLKIKLLNNFKVFILMIVTFNFYILTMLSAVNFNETMKSSYYLNKFHVALPCLIGNSIENQLSFSDMWCNEDKLENSICNGNYDKNIVPIQEKIILYFQTIPSLLIVILQMGTLI